MHRKIMLLSHNLTMRGSDVESVWIPPSGLSGEAWLMNDARKNNAALAQPYNEEKWSSKFRIDSMKHKPKEIAI